MPNYRRFDEVAVGDIFPVEPLRFHVGPEVVDGFLSATDNGSPLYSAENGSRAAPSMIAAVYLIDLLMARRSPPGGIHAKQAICFHRGLQVGETLSIQARVVETYIRKERPYVVSEFEAKGQDGSLVSTGRVTSIWGKDQ